MSPANGFLTALATRGSGSSRSALLGHLPRGSAIAFLACTAAALGLSPYFLQNLPHDFASDGSLRARESFASMSGSPPRGDREMRKSVVSGVVAGAIASGVIGGVAAPAHAQDAVQWRVEDGGNGHWYVADPTFRNWQDAQSLATSRGGHLATIHSSFENQFVLALALTFPSDYWLGAARTDRSCEPPCFEWVTGEVWSYEGAWNTNDSWGCGSPNPNFCGWNGPGTATVLELSARPAFSAGAWNDEAPSIFPAGASAILEWSADCNSDGVVDFGQIRAGELDDANANNIPDCCEQGVACFCPDIDGNGNVDAIDLAIVIGYWGTNGGKEYPQADIDRSGDIDAADLAALLGSWGPCE
jgi:hypothetical protein